MIIKVQTGERVIYQQEFDDGARLNQVVQFLMQLPAGTSWTTEVISNGHPLGFRTQPFEVRDLIGVANGPTKRRKTL